MIFFMKKFTASTLILVLALSLVGCGTDNQEQKTTTKTASNEYSVSGDNLSLDTTIETPPESINEVAVSTYEIRGDIAEKLFLENAEKINFEVPEDAGDYYEDSEGNRVNVIRSESIQYWSKFYWYVMNCFRVDPRDLQYNGNKFSKTKEFKFMSREEALNVLEDKVKELGVELGDIEYTCYSLDYKTLKKEEYAEDKYGNEDTSKYKDAWTSKDNCYFFAIRQKYNDIIEYHKFGGVYMNYEDCNCSIQAIVSERGVESLEIDCALKFENTGKQIKIMNPQQILDYISAKYGKVISGEKYTITSFNLCYMTDIINHYTVTPIYQCHMIEENDEGTRVEQVLINAVTGEEME